MSKVDSHIVIIGTGFAGIGMAIKLKQKGITNFIVLERSSHIGGTWRDNTYPGAACDISSHLYSYSYEPNPNWSRMFSAQKEIYDYNEHCVNKYGLKEYIRFNSEVIGSVFDEATGLWTLHIRDGGSITANIVINALGPLNRPQIPAIKGIETFTGKAFHSSEWDHSFDYVGKKVAVVGTGASAVQVVPAIAKEVEQLTIFQRSAPWVLPKPDRPMKDWEKKLFRILPFTQRLLRWRIYWVNEAVGFFIFTSPRLNKKLQNLLTGYRAKYIKDPVLREKLMPDYTAGCKRMTPSNEYYPALNRKNVAVETDGIDRIEGNTIITKTGQKVEADAIVFATGFQAADFPAGFEVTGRHGKQLSQEWKDGPEAYYGTAATGFPNFFFLIGPNTGLGHNSMIFMIESQVNFIVDAVKKMRRKKVKFIDVKPEVQKAYNEELQERLKGTVWATGCKSWYIAKNGRNTTVWPRLTFTFYLLTKRIKNSAFEWVK